MLSDLRNTYSISFIITKTMHALTIPGKKPLAITPLQKLSIDELKQELHARGATSVNKKKPELQLELRQLLEGVQRVPSLLLLNPTQDLQQTTLSKYEILSSEPLHDLKGHFSNLLNEIPSLLEGNVHTQCVNLIAAKIRQKVSAADIRTTMIALYAIFQKADISPDVLNLAKTAVKISEILYSSDEKRTPKQLLSLYNTAWLHMELCKKLLPQPHCSSRRKFYGTYLHALTKHAPLQLEIVCQKSINSENQERLFGQGRKAAEMASNRHSENIISTALLRLQAKKETGKMLHSVNEADSQVSRAAATIRTCTSSASTFKKTFVAERQHSWQAHLERISPFIVHGEGVWWEQDEAAYYFRDGPDDLDFHQDGPGLLHYRDSSIQKVVERQHRCWKQALDQHITLPTATLFTYDDEGELQNISTFDGEESNEDLNLQIEFTHILQAQPTEVSTTKIQDQTSKSQCTSPSQSISCASPSQSTVCTSPSQSTACTSQGQAPGSSYVLQTKLGRAIHKAIGYTAELRTLDNLRHQMKLTQHKGEKTYTYSKEYKQYQLLKHTLKELTLKTYTQLKQTIKLKEKACLQKHNCLPSLDDTEYTAICKQLKSIKWLLQVWDTL